MYILPYPDFLIALNVFAIFLEVLWVWCFATCSFIPFIKTNLINLYIKKGKGRTWRGRESLGVFREWWCLNRMRWSSPLGEKHDSECWSDGSGRKVGGESGNHSSTISVTSWNSAPDGLDKWKNYSESVFGFAWVSFIDVCNSLAEVVLGGWAIVDSLESEDGLIGVLGNFGSELLGSYLLKLRNLALTQSLTCLPGPALAIFLLLGAVAAAWDIWLKLIIVNIKGNNIVEIENTFHISYKTFYFE